MQISEVSIGAVDSTRTQISLRKISYAAIRIVTGRKSHPRGPFSRRVVVQFSTDRLRDARRNGRETAFD
jgi:hypothetical protein